MIEIEFVPINDKTGKRRGRWAGIDPHRVLFVIDSCEIGGVQHFRCLIFHPESGREMVALIPSMFVFVEP